jgi:hypothetical protein
MARKTINNIEKAMSAGGRDEAPRLNIKQFIKMAEKDPEVLRFDAESEINQLMREKYLKERKPGESFIDFIKRLDDVEIKRITLEKGGAVELSKESLISFLKNEYPKTYQRFEKDLPGMKVIEIKNILNNLDKDGVPFAKGGIIKDPTFTNYNES